MYETDHNNKVQRHLFLFLFRISLFTRSFQPSSFSHGILALADDVLYKNTFVCLIQFAHTFRTKVVNELS